MVIMLMLVAGISAGEFYYMLRSDAKLPNEMLGIVAAVLYPLSVFLYGPVGADGVFGAAARLARVVRVLAESAHSRCGG